MVWTTGRTLLIQRMPSKGEKVLNIVDYGTVINVRVFSRIKKKIHNYIRLTEYSVYTADLTTFNQAPEPNVKAAEFTISIGDKETARNLDKDIPDSMKIMWSKLVERKEFQPVLIFSPEGKLANYSFYSTKENVFIREFDQYFHLNADEIYLSSERTLEQYRGRGLSGYGKKYLFYEMNKKGYRKAFIFVRSNNPAPNHVNKQIGMALTDKYFVLRIGKKHFVIRKRIGNG